MSEIIFNPRCCLAVQTGREIDSYSVRMDFKSLGFANFSPGVSHPVEATVLDGIISPTVQSGHIELTVLGMKIAPHHTGQEIAP